MLFSSKVLLGLLLALSFSTGCEQKSANGVKVQVIIPALKSLSAIQPDAVPNTLADFDCVGLNVTGPGIDSSQGLGLVSNLVTSVTGGSLLISVPVGLERHFKVIGIVSASHQCPEQISRGSLMSTTSFPTVAVVGEKLADISADTTLRISNTYSLASATDVRTGDSLGSSPITPTPTPFVPTNCADNASLFAGGVGSVVDPLLISSVTQWNAIGDEPTRMSCSYKLTASLDFTGATPVAIGGSGVTKLFTGVIDGNGNTLSNFVLPEVSETERFFGLITDLRGTVKNLNINNVSVVVATGTKSLQVGSIAARIQNPGRIEDIEATGLNIRVNSTQAGTPLIGGLVGNIGGGGAVTLTEIKVENIVMQSAVWSEMGGVVGKMSPSVSLLSRARVKTATFTVTGGQGGFGGLVGNLSSGTVEDSLVNGLTTTQTGGGSANLGGAIGTSTGDARRLAVINTTLSGAGLVGGLVGQFNGFITDSYCRAALSTTGLVGGGAFGTVGNGFGPKFLRVYTASTMANANSYRRAFYGSAAGAAASGTEDSFFDSTLRADAGSYLTFQITGRTTTQMKTQGTYANWNFSTVWSIAAGDYPRLISIADLY